MQVIERRLDNLEDLLKTCDMLKLVEIQRITHELRQANQLEIYVGGIEASRIYRIAFHDIENGFELKFRAPCERDRFMMAFEKYCQSQGYRIIKSY